MGWKRSLRNSIVLTILVAGVALAGYVCLRTTSSHAAGERYRTEVVGLGEVTQTVSATGALNPVVLVRVGTQVSGTVRKLHADFNHRVQPGTVLVELDDALFQAQALQSEANVDNARAALELAVANEARVRQLHRQGFISRQELDQTVQAAKSARAQLALAQAQLQKDRTNLGYTVIRSPVSGVVVDRQVDVGQTVAASFQTPTLFLIAQDLAHMQIDSSFTEADIGNIRVGQPVHFKVDAFPDRSFQGSVKLVRLNPVTQQNVVTYDVVVAVDNPDEILLPGMTAYANIVIARRQGVLVVPNAALRFRPVEPASVAAPQWGREEKREGPTATVYMLENDHQRGQLRRVGIVPGITDNRYTEVVSGELEPGGQVVVEDRQAAAAASPPAGTLPDTAVLMPAAPVIRPLAPWQALRDRGGAHSGAEGREPRHRAGGIRHHHGPFRVGEIDPDEHPRLPRRAERRDLRVRGLRRHRVEPGPTRRSAQPSDRLRFPGLQPAAQGNPAGQRGAAVGVCGGRQVGAAAESPLHAREQGRELRGAPACCSG